MEDLKKLVTGLREGVTALEIEVLPVLPKIELRLVAAETGRSVCVWVEVGICLCLCLCLLLYRRLIVSACVCVCIM